MAIDLEFCTLLFPKDLIEQSFPGGIEEFCVVCGGYCFKEDENLIGISTMSTRDCMDIVDQVMEKGYPDRYQGTSSWALVERIYEQKDLPAWLNIGREGGSNVWHAEHEKGAVVYAPDGFLMQDLDLSWPEFLAAVEEQGVAVGPNIQEGDKGEDSKCEERFFQYKSAKLSGFINLSSDENRLKILWLFPPYHRIYGNDDFVNLKAGVIRALATLGLNGAVQIALEDAYKLDWKSENLYWGELKPFLEQHSLVGCKLVLVTFMANYGFVVAIESGEFGKDDCVTYFIALEKSEVGGGTDIKDKVIAEIVWSVDLTLDSEGNSVFDIVTRADRRLMFTYSEKVSLICVDSGGRAQPLGL